MNGLVLVMLVALGLECGTVIGTPVWEAKCEMDPVNSADWQQIEGTIRLRQVGINGPVTIYVQLSGFNISDGITKHGFHIHENGDISNKCQNLGPHYNPDGVNHGGRWTEDVGQRHPGDFGNLEEQGDAGEVYDTVMDPGITLIESQDNEVINGIKRYYIVGKPLDIHVGEDDLGLGDQPNSLTNGNAGSKVACCLIEVSKGFHFNEAICKMDESSPGAVDTQVITGDVIIRQLKSGGMTTYDINLEGFDATDDISKHGFHVHLNGSTENMCSSAKGHYNPHGVYHGAPDKSLTGTTGTRHVGDLGNVDESDGKVVTTIADLKSGMRGENSILNRALVVHEHADDLGLKNTAASRASGDAGKRLGCCVIIQAPASILAASAITHRSYYLISLVLPVAIALLGLRR